MFNRYLYWLFHSYCSNSWDSNIVLIMLLHLYPVFPDNQTTTTCTNVCVYHLIRSRVLGQINTVHNFVMWWYKGPYCVFYHMTRCLESVIKVSVLMFWWNILACDKKKKEGHSALNILCSRPTCVTLCRSWSPRPLILGSWSPVLHAWCKILDKLEKYLWPWCKQWSSNREKYIIKQQSDILSALFVTQNMYYYEYYTFYG